MFSIIQPWCLQKTKRFISTSPNIYLGFGTQRIRDLAIVSPLSLGACGHHNHVVYIPLKWLKWLASKDSVDDSPSIPIRNSTWVRIPARAGKRQYPNKVRVVPFNGPSIQNDVVRSEVDSTLTHRPDEVKVIPDVYIGFLHISNHGVVSLENHNFLKMLRNKSTWVQFYLSW